MSSFFTNTYHRSQTPHHPTTTDRQKPAMSVIRTELTKIINQASVVVFSKSYCPFCNRVGFKSSSLSTLLLLRVVLFASSFAATLALC
jgi:hypothetical protein